MRPYSRAGLIRYQIAPKYSLSGLFCHCGLCRNPGVAGLVRSYNLVFTYPCQMGRVHDDLGDRLEIPADEWRSSWTDSTTRVSPHFNGLPLASLARETIQNSLDAPGTSGAPVHVEFELINLRPEDIGRDELAEAIKACQQEARDDAMAKRGLEAAQNLIKENTTPCLRVSDRNTTGLRGDQWRTLVK